MIAVLREEFELHGKRHDTTRHLQGSIHLIEKPRYLANGQIEKPWNVRNPDMLPAGGEVSL